MTTAKASVLETFGQPLVASTVAGKQANVSSSHGSNINTKCSEFCRRCGTGNTSNRIPRSGSKSAAQM